VSGLAKVALLLRIKGPDTSCTATGQLCFRLPNVSGEVAMGILA
jgi:hypothetical protein